MNTEKDQAEATEAIVAGAGSVAGAVIGIIAGPVGVVAGAVMGSVIGAAAGALLMESTTRKWHHDEELDTTIGVYDGAMGAASPNAPPARIGAFSSGSSGAWIGTPQPAEGPMQDLED